MSLTSCAPKKRKEKSLTSCLSHENKFFKIIHSTKYPLIIMENQPSYSQ